MHMGNLDDGVLGFDWPGLAVVIQEGEPVDRRIVHSYTFALSASLSLPKQVYTGLGT